MRRIPLAAGALLASATCIAKPVDRVPPGGAFYFPESLAIRHLGAAGQDCAGGAPGCTTQLLVVNTNFDLRFDYARGGTLLSVAVPPDPATPPADADLPLRPPLDVRGAVRIGSLGGELALLEDRPTLAARVLGGGESLCSGWSTAADPARTPQALVASRVTRRLHRVGLRADLGLDCDGDCAVSLDDPTTAADDRDHDPYGVGVVCRGSGDAYSAEAYVTFLSTPGNTGVLGRVSLLDGTVLPSLGAGSAAAHTATYDAGTDRLYFTGRFTGPGYIPFRYLELGNSSVVDARVIDLAQQVRGAETRGFSLSGDRRRAYVALRLYDADLASRIGGRTPDVGGAIGVVDLAPDPLGNPSGRLLAVVPVGLAPSDVQVVPRPGRRDVVVVTCSGDDTLWIYDDEAGAVAKVFARSPGGPLLGSQPGGLAVESRADGRFRIYVAAFASHAVSVIDLDPAAPSLARRYMALGDPLP